MQGSKKTQETEFTFGRLLCGKLNGDDVSAMH